MSVVVALKYDNGVVIGADKQGTADYIYKQEITKLKQFEYSKVAMGACGTLDNFIPFLYMEEIIDFEHLYKKNKITSQYIYERVCPKIKNTLKEKGLLDNGKHLNIEYLLATNELIVCVDSTFMPIVVNEKFYSIGCGHPEVMGYLNVALDGVETKNITKDEAIKYVEQAIQLACKNDCYIGMGIDLFVLEKDD